jgi:hypothetical protein
MSRPGDVDPAEPIRTTAAARSYELATTRISRRTSRPTLATAAAIVGLLAIATAIGLLDRGGIPATGRARSEPGHASPRPVAVRCHDLDAGSCHRVAAAALDVMGPDAAVESIDVWHSLLCGDDLDCPPGRLAGLHPLGSAVVGLGDDERPGWINVGERLATPAAGEPALVVWLIR